MTEIQSRRVIMSPEFARHYLGLNTANRPLNKRRVQVLAEAIKRGEWVEDGNPIRVADDNSLADGQHRLAAIIQAEIPVPVLLVTGLPSQGRLTIDSGIKRSFGHYLSIIGTPQTAAVAAACRALWTYQRSPSFMEAGLVPTNAQLYELFLEHEDDILAAVRISDRVADHARGSRSIVALAYVVFSGIDGETAEDFFADLYADNPEHSAVQTLVRTLNDPKNERWVKAGNIQTRRRLLAYYIKTWNSYRSGTGRDLLRWNPSGKAAESFPVPMLHLANDQEET